MTIRSVLKKLMVVEKLGQDDGDRFQTSLHRSAMWKKSTETETTLCFEVWFLLTHVTYDITYQNMNLLSSPINGSICWLKYEFFFNPKL